MLISFWKILGMQDLKERTFRFAITIGKLVLDLPDTTINREYLRQLIKSSSSVGANYRAARRARSDADFLNKLKIVEEETDESVYFLELLREFNEPFNERIEASIKEGTEILKIIVASINTTRSRIGKKLRNF
jgi:four helix bundle protein